MRIASLGYDFADEQVAAVSYGSARMLLEFDLVIWGPAAAVLDFMLESNDYKGRRVVSRAESSDAIATVYRRREEMEQLLSLGKVLVIFVPAAPTFFVYTGTSKNTGTAAKPSIVWNVAEIRMEELFPFPLELQPATGTEMELKVGDPFAAFWKAAGDIFVYVAYMTKMPVTSTVVLRGTTHPVAGVGKVGNGIVILLPDIAEEAWDDVPHLDDDGNEVPVTVPGFIDALLALVSELSGDAAEALAPWTERYLLPGEEELAAELAEAERCSQEALTAVDAATAALLRRRRLKRQFAGTGTALELAVREAFEALRCMVEDGPANRTELIVRREDRVAVVEVKGLTGSAAERNSVQLEKWVSEYIEAHEQHPKPILVVNAFRGNMDLAGRQQAFPHQMLDYATKRDHCLITGLQLLGAATDIEAHPDRADAVIESLFACVGVWDQFTDPTTFLGETPDGAVSDGDQAQVRRPTLI